MLLKYSVVKISIAVLVVASCVLIMLISNSFAYYKARREMIDHIVYEQQQCYAVNEALQQYQRGQDCSAYGNLLTSIKDVDSQLNSQ